jgi:metal-responsive CopG/Arc/MetJ family transcriptional regulator
MNRFTLHLPEELYQQLKAAADREGISMSAVVRRALEQELGPPS